MKKLGVDTSYLRQIAGKALNDDVSRYNNEMKLVRGAMLRSKVDLSWFRHHSGFGYSGSNIEELVEIALTEV